MGFFDIFKKVDKFSDGYNYADAELKKGTDKETLYRQADNAFDFDDFDRGILQMLRESKEE